MERVTISPLAIFAAVVAVVVLFAVSLFVSSVSAASSESPRDRRLVTIHDRGSEQVILTKAGTVEEALKQAGVSLDGRDTVEPAVKEKLVATDYSVNIYRARPVIVVDGAVRQKIMTPYQTASKIAEDAGLKLQDEDKTKLTTSDDIVSDGAGLTLTIERSTAMNLILYGKKTTVYTQEKTVDAMLKSKNITLSSDDTLSVAGSTSITEGMTIELWRNGVQTVTEDQPIAFDTEKVQNPDQPVGFREVKTAGVNGKKSVTYEIEMKNGKEVARKEIQTVVVEQPKKQVEVVGTKMTNTFSGDFAGALARLRSCEGSYTSNTGNGYYGAYQYDLQTWGGYKGYANASLAPPAVQDEKVWITYQARGWQPWPSCSKKMGLQDIYR